MLSFNSLYNRAAKMCGIPSTDTTNLTFLKQLINEKYHLICDEENYTFLDATKTSTTTASTQSYELPYNIGKLINVSVTIGGKKYYPQEISKSRFDLINAQGTSILSDYPQFFTIFNDQIHFYPVFSSGSLTITFNYKKIVKDLSTDDYTTGTASITTGTSYTAITGVGTTWTAAMIGRYFKFNDDGFWYEITSRTSNTVIAIKRSYGGSDVSGGNYTIGEMSIIPEAFQSILWYGTMADFLRLKGDEYRSNLYDGKYNALKVKLDNRYKTSTTGQIIPPTNKIRAGGTIRSQNNYPESIG